MSTILCVRLLTPDNSKKRGAPRPPPRTNGTDRVKHAIVRDNHRREPARTRATGDRAADHRAADHRAADHRAAGHGDWAD
jgi:hypothetical protein